MPEPLQDEWFSRDEKVLFEAGRRLQDGHITVPVPDLADALEIDTAAVRAAVTVLVEDGYVRGFKAMGGYLSVDGLTIKGRRHVGIWPSEDDATAFMQALEAAADAEPDETKKSKIRSVLEGVRDMGTTVTGQVLSAYVKAHLGVG